MCRPQEDEPNFKKKRAFPAICSCLSSMLFLRKTAVLERLPGPSLRGIRQSVVDAVQKELFGVQLCNSVILSFHRDVPENFPNRVQPCSLPIVFVCKSHAIQHATIRISDRQAEYVLPAGEAGFFRSNCQSKFLIVNLRRGFVLSCLSVAFIPRKPSRAGINKIKSKPIS